jgi:hypothetical protein
MIPFPNAAEITIGASLWRDGMRTGLAILIKTKISN